MRRIALPALALTLLGGAALLPSTPAPLAAVPFAAPLQAEAQAVRHRVGFVDVTRVTAAVPGGEALSALQTRIDTDLRTRRQTIASMQAAVARGQASAQQRQALTTAQQALARAEAAHAQALQQAAAPVLPRVNRAVNEAARQQGFTVVLDRAVAARSGAVVYANEQATDLTAAAVARARAQR